MSESKFKAIKWEVDVAVDVTLSFDQPRVSDNPNYPGRKNIWYGIKAEIDGKGPNGFNATENLKEMIDLVGAEAGTTITIEKKQGEKFAYFTVNGKTLQQHRESGIKVNIDTESTPSNVEFVKPKQSYSKDEKIKILWADYCKKNNIIEEDDIPF